MTSASTFLLDRGISTEVIKRAKIAFYKDRIEIPYYFSGVNKKIPVKVRRLFCNNGEPKYYWKKSGMSPKYPYFWSSLLLPKANVKRKIFITEGELDALLLLSILEDSPFYNQTPIRIDYGVIALPLGANCWKKEWNEAFSKIAKPGVDIYTFFDNDDAGLDGLRKFVNKINRPVYQADWPDWMDTGQDLTDYISKQKFEDLNFRQIKVEKPKTRSIPSNTDLIVKRQDFSDEDLEKIKQYPLDRLLEQFGIQLKKCSIGYNCLCPFHKEKNPSFYIYRDTNSFYCFSCGKGGSVIDFLQYYDNRSVSEAIDYIKKLINING